MSEATKLYRNTQKREVVLDQLQQVHSNEVEAVDAMQFGGAGGSPEEEAFSTMDTLLTTYQSVGNQSVLFDIMQTKLSDNVQPVSSKHIAIGQHCIDMLIRRDHKQVEKLS